MPEAPKYPWRIETNDRYRELASLIIGLSAGALFVPVFLARELEHRQSSISRASLELPIGTSEKTDHLSRTLRLAIQ